MLSAEANDRYNNVEPGSPLNRMAKRQWLPFLRSEALEAGGAPRKVELLGEFYVAFRAADGRIGFFDEACPHRGASLVLARTGDNALTCIFHGWRFSVEGKCVDAMNEANPKFCATVKLRSHSARDAGGVLWVYLGEGEPPVFPHWEFFDLPATHRRARVGYTESNWTRNLETLLDSAHIGILHAEPAVKRVNDSVASLGGIHAPKLSVRETRYGLQGYARRERADGSVFLRVTEFIAPFTVLNGTMRTEESRLLFMIPINNRRTAFWRIEWDMNHDQEWWRTHSVERGALELKFVDLDDFLANSFDRSKPDFGQDRAAMAAGHWSGFKDLRAEDAAVAEMIPLVDRRNEHRGASDLVIARMRRQFFDALEAFEKGGPALGLGAKGDGSGIPYTDLRGTSEVIDAAVDMEHFHNVELPEERRRQRAAFHAAAAAGAAPELATAS